MPGNPPGSSSSGGELRIEIERRGDVAVVTLAGSAHMTVSTDLRDQLVELADETTRQLVIDLSDLEFISSLGLGGIVAAHLRSRKNNGSVELVNPRPQIRDLLSVTQLTRLFPIHESVDAALRKP